MFTDCKEHFNIQTSVVKKKFGFYKPIFKDKQLLSLIEEAFHLYDGNLLVKIFDIANNLNYHAECAPLSCTVGDVFDYIDVIYDSQQDQIQEFGSSTGWTNQVKANLIECSSFCPVIPMIMRHPYDNYNILTFKTIAYDQKTTNAYQAIIHAANTQPWNIYDYSGILDIFNEISDFEKETKTNKDFCYIKLK